MPKTYGSQVVQLNPSSSPMQGLLPKSSGRGLPRGGLSKAGLTVGPGHSLGGLLPVPSRRKSPLRAPAKATVAADLPAAAGAREGQGHGRVGYPLGATRARAAYTLQAITAAAAGGLALGGWRPDQHDVAAAQLLLLRAHAPGYLRDSGSYVTVDGALLRKRRREASAYGLTRSTERLAVAEVEELSSRLRR